MGQVRVCWVYPKLTWFFRVNFYPTRTRPESQNTQPKFIFFASGFRSYQYFPPVGVLLALFCLRDPLVSTHTLFKLQENFRCDYYGNGAQWRMAITTLKNWLINIEYSGYIGGIRICNFFHENNEWSKTTIKFLFILLD